MAGTKRQLRALFFTRFANAYGLVTLLTLLSTYIELLGATGLVAGMFVTGLTLAQAVAVLPVAYIGDRFDKRFILLVGLGLATAAYAAFPVIETSLGFTAEGNAAAAGATAVAVIVSAEKFTNMLSQPYMGGLSDRFGRAQFVFLGGLFYGVVAIVVPFTPAIGSALGLPAVFPYFGDLSSAFIPLLVVTGLLGVADSIREPASMALFADEGAGSGVAASFGVRDLVWRPGSILAPLAGGWLMTNAGMERVFFLGAATAFTGVIAFLGILSYDHGRAGLTKW